MANATVMMVEGQAWVEGEDGVRRELKPGDTLEDGQRLTTSSGGRVVIDFGGDTEPAVLSGTGQVNFFLSGEGDLDARMDAVEAAISETEATVNSGTPRADQAELAAQADNVLGDQQLNDLLAAIDSGSGDLLDELEAPAAGGVGGAAGAGDEGSTFVRLLRIVESVDPLAFEFGLERAEDIEFREFDAIDDADPDADDEGVTLTGLEGPGDPGGPGGPGGPGDPGGLPIGASSAEQTLFEANLSGGSSPDAASLTRAGSFGFTAGDGLATLSVGGRELTLAQLNALGTSPQTILTAHGVLTLTGFSGTAQGGSVAYTYVLDDNVDNDSQAGATDGGFLDSLSVVAVDVDGSSATGSLDILIVDDAPQAVDDPTSNTTDDVAVTINVINNAEGADTLGADGGSLTGAELVDPAAGTLSFSADGQVTFTPAAGFEGTAEILYTITDNDGDTSQATWQVVVENDEPEIEVDPEEPNAEGNSQVDEAGLDDGGSQAATDLETTSGSLNIDTGSDGVGSLVLKDKDGNDVNVTNGGTVQGSYGVLTVSVSAAGDYTYSYTLDDNTTEHSTQGTDSDGIRDDFAVTLTDSDGDVATTTLTIDVKDDVPQQFSSVSDDLEDGGGSLDFADNAGADGVGSVVFSASLDGMPVTDSDGFALLVDGKPMVYSLSTDGTTLFANSTDNSSTGFVVTLEPDGSSYSIEMGGEVTNGANFEASLEDGQQIGDALALSTSDGVEGNDLLMTYSDGSVVVTGGEVAVANGQSIRIDALTGLANNGGTANWNDHRPLSSLTQSVSVGGGEGATAALLISAVLYAADDAANADGPGTTGSLLDLAVDDVRVFNSIGVDVTDRVTLTDDGDAIRVEGLHDGWQVRLETDGDRPFEAVNIESASGELLLGDVDYRVGGPPADYSLDLGLVGTDGDGDMLESTLTLNGDAPPKLYVDDNDGSEETGGGGDDVLIGDSGGVQVEPAESYNISLIVDTSGSMADPSGTPGKTRMQLAQEALKNLVGQLSEHGGTINLQIIDFDTGSVSTVIDDFGPDKLNLALAAINSMVAFGGTNYEAGFNRASSFFDDHDNGLQNLTYFLTDGVPTRYVNNNGTPGGNGFDFTSTVMTQSIDAFDTLASKSSVAGIGIGNGIRADVLRFFDNTNVVDDNGSITFGSTTVTGPVGQIDIVNTADELAAALQDASSALRPAGDDTLSGGAGDDVLVGDTLNSDGLEWTNGDTNETFTAGTHDGLGYGGLYDYLTWTKDDGNGGRIDDTDGTPPTQAEIIDYVRANINDLIDDRDDGGANTLDGGIGNDTLVGGADDDTLLGGEGDDILIAGKGNDTLNGGAGDDDLAGGGGNDIIDLGDGADVVRWQAGDQGSGVAPAQDTVEQFSLGNYGTDAAADRLEMADLLDGATEADVSDYLFAEEDGSGNTVIHVKSDGGIDGSGSNADQSITLTGVDMGGQDSANFLQQMIDNNQLDVE